MQMVLGVFAFWGAIALGVKMISGPSEEKPAAVASAAPSGAKSDIPNMLSADFEVGFASLARSFLFRFT
jgi:hypothetical protein